MGKKASKRDLKGTQQRIFESLGNAGLVERLTPVESEWGVTNLSLVLNNKGGTIPERVQGIGDDFYPNPTWYNAIGAVYPLLTREQRDHALRSIIKGTMDGIRYDCVNRNHTPYIRDPQLLADITASSPLYWPGLHDDDDLWKGKNFEEIRKLMTSQGLFIPEKVKSDFVLSYVLLRKDRGHSFSEEFLEVVNPQFLQRVLKGIVNIRFVAIGRATTDEEKVEEGRKRLRTILPERLHDQIEPLRQEADYVIIPNR